ncbi:hypothetical protein DID73_02600, partial [Candidatus Marinamargulisbacteria bacterium SCGC AG-343-K17]
PEEMIKFLEELRKRINKQIIHRAKAWIPIPLTTPPDQEGINIKKEERFNSSGFKTITDKFMEFQISNTKITSGDLDFAIQQWRDQLEGGENSSAQANVTSTNPSALRRRDLLIQKLKDDQLVGRGSSSTQANEKCCENENCTKNKRKQRATKKLVKKTFRRRVTHSPDVFPQVLNFGLPIS